MGFASSFFSVKGQKERLSNVGKYIQLGASKITAGVIPAPKNTDMNYKSASKIANMAQAIVNNPKTAALAATGVAYAAKYAPTAASKAQTFFAKKTSKAMPGISSNTGNSGSTPGLIKPPQSGGLLTPSAGSSVPVAQNAGTITPSTARSASSSPRKRRKTSSPSKRKRTTKRKTRRSKRSKKRFGTAKQYARPGGKKVFYAKNGTPYIKLANGKARFVKGKRK